MPDTTIIPTIPTAPVTPAILESLRAIVGDKGLISDDQGKQPFVTDWRGSIVGNAAVVVRPATVEEVSKVVKLCHDNGIAIVPQAGNTSLMGGAAPFYRCYRCGDGRDLSVGALEPQFYRELVVKSGAPEAEQGARAGQTRLGARTAVRLGLGRT